MIEFAAAALLPFYADIDVFVLIMVRIVGFLLLVPVLAGMSVPAAARIAIALGLAAIVFFSGTVGEIEYTPNMVGYFNLVVIELVAGIVMGFVVYSTFAIIFLLGELIDRQIGFAMASVFDPVLQLQVPVMGNLIYFTMMAIFIVSGGLTSFIGALILSFELAPIGQLLVLENNVLLLYILGTFTGFFLLAVQFALPIAGSIFIIDIMLGILVKAVPQMNVFVVGLPLKVMLGLALVMMLTPIFSIYYFILYEMAAEALMAVIGGISP